MQNYFFFLMDYLVIFTSVAQRAVFNACLLKLEMPRCPVNFKSEKTWRKLFCTHYSSLCNSYVC